MVLNKKTEEPSSGLFLTRQNSPEKQKRKRKKRLFLLVGGIILILAAFAFIGQAIYNLRESEFLTDESLTEAKELVKELRPPEGQRATPAVSGDKTINASATDGNPAEASAKMTAPLINRPAGTVLGYIIFDSLKGREVPIIEGAEPDQLKKGAGHHEDMAYPGQSGNCLLFGHRNTVFRGFGDLKKGDTIQLKTEYGTFTYTISDMQVTFPLDPLMFKEYTDPYLTLVTCYPFDFVGAAPKRYVVICQLTDSKK